MGYWGKDKRIPNLIQDHGHQNSIQDQIMINFIIQQELKRK